MEEEDEEEDDDELEPTLPPPTMPPPPPLPGEGIFLKRLVGVEDVVVAEVVIIVVVVVDEERFVEFEAALEVAIEGAAGVEGGETSNCAEPSSSLFSFGSRPRNRKSAHAPLSSGVNRGKSLR